MKERTEILRHMYTNEGSIINSNNKIYGVCRHKASFHRYKEEESYMEAVATAWWADDAKRVKENVPT